MNNNNLETLFDHIGLPKNSDTRAHAAGLIEALVDQKVAEGRRTGYAKGVEILAWRIDCSTMISELSGWRGCVEMAKEQAMSLRDAQLNPQKSGEEEV